MGRSSCNLASSDNPSLALHKLFSDMNLPFGDTPYLKGVCSARRRGGHAKNR